MFPDPIRFGKVVAEPCTIQTIKVPNHYRVPTLAPLACQIDIMPYGHRGPKGSGPAVHATRARLACPLGNAKEALDTIA